MAMAYYPRQAKRSARKPSRQVKEAHSQSHVPPDALVLTYFSGPLVNKQLTASSKEIYVLA